MNTANIIEKQVLDLYKTTAYQRLNAYYGQRTVFSVLGIERNENRHSAFLEWLFNPKSSHGLSDSPLKKFLALVATYASDEDKCFYDQVRQHLISGNYTLRVESIKTEQSIIGLAKGATADFKNIVEVNDNGAFKKDSNNRFDIWMLLIVNFMDDNDQEQQWYLPVVVENKIYSTEGNANDGEKAQTVRYTKAVNILKNLLCPTNYCQPLLVFLTPSGAKHPADKAFVHLTYQDLLDHVIQPCAILSSLQGTARDVRVLMDGYVRNLSCPSNNDDESSRDYTILAIADTESKDLSSVFESQAFQKALCAIYPKEAQTLLGENYKAEEPSSLLEQTWNTNEDLFKIVLFNQFKDDEDQLKYVNRIIKVNNRDNTRYLIGLEQGKWLNASNRPASKSEASFLIFYAYCEQWKEKHPNETLDLQKLRDAFKGELNSYYHNRFLQHLFYDFEEEVAVDIKESKHFGNVICQESDAWDFYWDDAHVLPNVKGEVRSVKMWRKGDFDKLVKKAQEYGIVVESAG